jgi:hypothetical protein
MAATKLASGAAPTWQAFVAGLVVLVPFVILVRFFVLLGLVPLALAGLAVPAAMIERLGVRRALRRGLELARADFVHALGGLAALVLVYIVSSFALLVLLRTQGEQAQRVAGGLAALVLSPLVFLGAALLYFDQAARVVDSGRPRSRRSGDADLRAAVDPDAAGRPDAEVQPGPAPPGQQ